MTTGGAAPLSREYGRGIARDVLARISAAVPRVKALVNVTSTTSASARLARNEVLNVGGRDSVQVRLFIDIDGQRALAVTDRQDALGLAALVADTEQLARQNQGGPTSLLLRAAREFADPPLYFDSSRDAAAAQFQGDLIRRVAEATEAADMVGTGNVAVSSQSLTVVNSAGVDAYTRSTYAEVSVSARTRDGRGSGWAWQGTEDFSRIEPRAVATRAIDIAGRSASPIAVEPGRYTVILEPEAMAQLVEMPILGAGTDFVSAESADHGRTVFSLLEAGKPVRSKLGLQMADRRVQLYYDPMDREIPFSPLADDGEIRSRTYWIEDGVLRNLAHDATYARRRGMSREEVSNPKVGKLEVSGPTQTLEEMIATTKRGIWVHRFSGVSVMSPLTLLLTGVTRDGTFLIENGKITKAIKNLRFSESPFFILNKIEAFGPPVRASQGLACPRLKVRDFEFTSLSDAI